MRRVLLAVVATFAVASCEDGPTQTFNPAPEGAGNRWNDGNNAGSADPASQGFNGDVGGATKQEICTGPEKKAKWAALLSAPITPPRMGAKLDMAGSDKWEGLTIEQAEQTNCQSVNLDVGYNYWGDNGEVTVGYRVSTRKINYLGFDQGYTGSVDFKSRDGKSVYKLTNSVQVKKGAPGGALNGMTISWDDDPNTGVGTWANEISDALFATFAPGLPAETNCMQNGHCVIGFFGDQGYLFLPALGFGFRVASVAAAQPTPSTVSYMDVYLEKVLPFSQANPILKLDALGPIAVAGGLGPAQKTCSLKMGMTYADLLGNCVQVSGNSAADQAELNKLLGGLSHNTERFGFDLSGVDVNFTDRTLAADQVVRDADQPTVDDVATRFDVDQSTLGAVLNDYTSNDVTKAPDYHGTGLVYAEFVRLVQESINATLPAAKRHQLGDAACLTGNPQTFADGCTGFEGFVVPLDATKIDDVNVKKLAVSPTSPVVDTIKNGGGIKPGHQKVVFCNDVARTKCSGGDTFPTSWARLVSVLGKGSTSTLPPDMQDARFFFQMWSTAFFKYLMAETLTGSATATQVKNAQLDPNNLFFDSVGAGQWETAEYVDRRFVTSTQDPTDVQITADVKNGIFDDYEFSRDLYRGESAIYTAMRTDGTKPLGSENNALLSNVFGSPVLSSMYHGHQNASAFQCATGAKSVTDCEGEGPPRDAAGALITDSLGRPVLSSYQAAIDGSSVLQLGGTSPVSILQTYPAIESAMIKFKPPHAGTSILSDVQFLIPWLPKQPGVGFPVAISGTIDKFVSTYQLDLSGTTISANVDYDFADPMNPDAGISFLAVESTDFLGEVFMCKDDASGDLLRVHMYSPAALVLDWFTKHPGTTQACGLVVRYSPYNNFPDYISSLTNGVRLGITQGGGFGRVVDVTLFVPGQ